MADQSHVRPLAPGPGGLSTDKPALSSILRKTDDEIAKQPSGDDHVSARAKQRMKETQQDRYNKHKAMARSTMMRIFTETMLPESWSAKDDAVMDALVTWVIDLQNRAGTKAEVSSNTVAATTKTEDLEVEADDDQGKQDK